MSKQETVEVTLEIPKAIVFFLRNNVWNSEEYMVKAIVERVGGDIDTLDLFDIKDDIEAKKIVKRYGLNEVLKDTLAGEFC